MTDVQLDTFKEILEEDSYALSEEGYECEGYTVLKVIEGEDRRWSRYVNVYVQFPDGRIFKWFYDQGLTEYQENDYPWESKKPDGTWYDEPVEVEMYTETITVTKFREKEPTT